MPTHSTGMPTLEAHDDFARARSARRAIRAVRRLTGRRGPDRPATLPADFPWRASVPRLTVLPLDAIVGTLEPTSHFDDRFRPASGHSRARWERVALATRQGTPLPPIEVRRGPDGFYVADGRHRVSVARAAGRREIEAWVR